MFSTLQSTSVLTTNRLLVVIADYYYQFSLEHDIACNHSPGWLTVNPRKSVSHDTYVCVT